MDRWTSQIGVDQQNVLNTVASQANGQIGRDKTLTISWHAAGNEDCLQRGFIASLIDVRAETAKLLNHCAALSQRRK